MRVLASMRFLSVSCFALVVVAPAFAGFDMTYQGAKTTDGYALPQYNVSMGTQKNLSDAVQPKDVSHVAVSQPESNAPAFQVYDERYVPDSVKKKYGLGNDWYGTGDAGGNQPMSLAPESMGTELPVEAVKPLVVVESWRGRKGESVREVLHRWSLRSGADLMWASADNPVLKDDFSFVGNFQDAVAGLMRSGGMGELSSQYRPEGLNPVMMSPASMVEAHTAPTESTKSTNSFNAAISQIFTPKPSERAMETRWLGLSGASLSEVLSVWGEDAGVQVIWQAEKNFALKDTVTQVGQFEDAVFSALSQYNDEPERPIGEMYLDPKSGQKVLVIRTDVPS